MSDKPDYARDPEFDHLEADIPHAQRTVWRDGIDIEMCLPNCPRCRLAALRARCETLERQADRANAAAGAAQEQVRVLRDALSTCRDRFKQYAAIHKAKGTDEGDLKAAANLEMVALADRALAQKGQEDDL